MPDLQTQLSYFLNNLISSSALIQAGVTISPATNNVNWLARSVITSPADGVVEMTNNAATGFTRLILGTNDGTANGVSLAKAGGGALQVFTGDGITLSPLNAATITTNTAFVGPSTTPSAGDIRLQAPTGNSGTIQWTNGGKFSVPAQATTTSQVNTGNASIATFTVGASDAVFLVGAEVSVTASTNHTFSIDCVYTDAASNARTFLMPMTQLLTGNLISGALITNTLGVGVYNSVTIAIRAKASTSITLRTSAGGTFTGVTYTASGNIVQVG